MSATFPVHQRSRGGGLPMWPAVGQGGEGACRGLGRRQTATLPGRRGTVRSILGTVLIGVGHAVTAGYRHKTAKLQSSERFLLEAQPAGHKVRRRAGGIRRFASRPQPAHTRAAQRASAAAKSRYEPSGRPSRAVRRSTSPACGTMPSLTYRSAIRRIS